MKLVSLFLVLLLGGYCMDVQQMPTGKTSKTKTASSSKVSDSYAKAAIVAVRAIQSEDSSNPSKRTDEKIDATDAEAVTKPEMAISAELRRLFIRRSIRNLKIEAEVEAAKAAGKIPPAQPDPDAACFNAIVNSLQARSAKIPEVCAGDE
ncbi:MAG: hypothetical protein M3P45_08625 [Acidobacteriota bacterium]|nr:hypothetical protein [Acidobacteriota bacterium]